MDIWFNPRCSKCRIARDAADAAGKTYQLRHYMDDLPTAEELRDVITRLGLEPWEICRTADAPKVGAVLPAGRDAPDRERWIDTLITYPALIQRPIIVTDDGSAYVARDEDALAVALRDTPH